MAAPRRPKRYDIDLGHDGGGGCGYVALAIAVLRQAVTDLTRKHIDAADFDTADKFVFSGRPTWTSVREHWCSLAGMCPTRYQEFADAMINRVKSGLIKKGPGRPRRRF